MRSLAIIIAIYNEPESILKQCKEAFKGANLYVVVNENDVKTLDIAKSIFSNVIVAKGANHLKSALLNYALKEIKEDIVGIFDVDCVPSKNLFSKAQEAFNDDIGLVMSSEKYYNKDFNFQTKIDNFLHQDNDELVGLLYKKLLAGVLPILHAGYFMKTSTLRDIGFNENTITEDSDLALELAKRNIKGVIIPEYVSMSLPTTLKDAINQRTRWNTGGFTLHKQHPEIKDYPCLDALTKPDVKMAVLALLRLIGYVLTFPLSLVFIYSELELEHVKYMRTHGVVSRKITYGRNIYNYIYIIILMKAYYNFKLKPKYWHLTKKDIML